MIRNPAMISVSPDLSLCISCHVRDFHDTQKNNAFHPVSLCIHHAFIKYSHFIIHKIAYICKILTILCKLSDFVNSTKLFKYYYGKICTQERSTCKIIQASIFKFTHVRCFFFSKYVGSHTSPAPILF